MEARNVARLSPPIDRSYEAGSSAESRHSAVSLLANTLLEFFDRLDFGAVLLNERMRVVHANAAAQAVLDRADGLCLGACGRLESSGGHSGRMRLSQWLELVRDAPRAHFSDGYFVPRKDTGAHYVVQCTPLAAGPQEGRDYYVAFITDTTALRLPREDRLMQLYELTQMQARVALTFACGASYKEVARSLCISEETVRSHVKEIYPKARVRRQAELVRLVLSLGQSGI